MEIKIGEVDLLPSTTRLPILRFIAQILFEIFDLKVTEGGFLLRILL